MISSDFFMGRRKCRGIELPRSAIFNDKLIDTTSLKDVLLAYHHGDDDAVKANLDQLSEQHAKYLLESLAVVSSLDNRTHIFKLCMDRGFCYRHFWIMHANRLQDKGNTTAPEISKILDESEFRKLYPRYIAPDDVNRRHGTKRREIGQLSGIQMGLFTTISCWNGIGIFTGS
jgi:hypothetical protein